MPALVSFSIVLALVPALRLAAVRIGFVDRPNHRKIHAHPIPLMGGVALYAGCLAAVFLYDGGSARFAAIALGGTALVAIGLIDDWYKVRGKEFPVWPRLIVYAAVSAVPAWLGIQVVGVTNVAGEGMLLFPVWMCWLATMAWVFGITNMINFIDGVDGLASGIVTISSLTLLVVAVVKGEFGPAVLASALVGACLAFLIFNFYPARIFMGDAGAVFLGYVLAVLAVDGSFKSATIISILVPVLAIGVPILDSVFVMMRRMWSGKGLHRADKLHTHHTLMSWGLTQTQTVSFLYLIGALFSLLSIIVLLAFS
jgi:UDP-GlcNAc:undecaprenyl-phosphate GlcNAc-1-phosphate transferase